MPTCCSALTSTFTDGTVYMYYKTQYVCRIEKLQRNANRSLLQRSVYATREIRTYLLNIHIALEIPKIIVIKYLDIQLTGDYREK